MTLSERLREAAQRRGECFDSDGMPIEAAFRDLGFSESHLFGEAADELDRLTARVAELEKDADQVVRKTAERCREMALWPQGIDDEQAYYGRMFAEFIDREFKLDAARRTE